MAQEKQNEPTQEETATDAIGSEQQAEQTAPEIAEDSSKQTESASSDAEKLSLDALKDALSQATSDVSESELMMQRLTALEEEKAQMHDKALRAVAEMENIRRRAEREKQDMAKFAATNFARDMISTFENLTRASASISKELRESSQEINNLAMGVEMTLKELQQSFTKHGIARIDPMGEPFDHNRHQAMTKIETDEHPEGTVVQVLQAAYTMHERLLQPALVAVATAPKETTQASPDEGPQHVDTTA